MDDFAVFFLDVVHAFLEDFGVGASEGVDGLFEVADEEEVFGIEGLDEVPLFGVCVLEFVDHEVVAVLLDEMLDGGVLGEELDAFGDDVVVV